MALSLCLAGAFVYWQGNQIGGGILLRSGFVLGAIWLAWPRLATLNPRWLLPGVGRPRVCRDPTRDCLSGSCRRCWSLPSCGAEGKRPIN